MVLYSKSSVSLFQTSLDQISAAQTRYPKTVRKILLVMKYNLYLKIFILLIYQLIYATVFIEQLFCTSHSVQILDKG